MKNEQEFFNTVGKALIYFFIMPLLVLLLLIVVARSNDDREAEELRRENMTKTIGDEN